MCGQRARGRRTDGGHQVVPPAADVRYYGVSTLSLREPVTPHTQKQRLQSTPRSTGEAGKAGEARPGCVLRQPGHALAAARRLSEDRAARCGARHVTGRRGDCPSHGWWLCPLCELYALLELGASANVCDGLGNTPLVHAVIMDNEPIARVLLPHTNVHLVNGSGINAFHASSHQGRLSYLKLLLPHFLDDVDVRTVQARIVPGVDNPNVGKPHNCTALTLACVGGHHRIVRELLANGASRTAADSTGCTPLILSANNGHLVCLVMLLGRPGDYKLSAAEVNARNADGATALHCAAHKGHRTCCAVLIAAGADLNATWVGLTPLDAALANHADDAELIALLEGGVAVAGVPPAQLCDGCGIPSSQAPGGKLRACSACQSAAFCSTACMAQAWPGHRAECQRIKAAKEEKARSHIRILPSSLATTPAPP